MANLGNERCYPASRIKINPRPTSGTNLNRCFIIYGTPDLIHLLVGNSYASVGPIVESMGSADEAIICRQTMDENVSARRDAPLASRSRLVRRWVGNVQRLVVLALRVPESSR